MKRNKIILEPEYDPYLGSKYSIINDVESEGILDDAPDGHYYVSIYKYNQSGHALLNLAYRNTDAKTALRLFRFLNLNYPAFEITILRIGRKTYSAVNQAYLNANPKQN